MKSLKGSLLIASPGLMDPNFLRTVIIVAEHSEEGALGLVLNRPAEAKVAELWTSISGDSASTELNAFVGGPVQKNALLILHGHDDLAGGSEAVIPGVYMSSEVEIFGKLLSRESEPDSEGAKRGLLRVFCGYSGWGPGQLDREMKDGGWLTCEATSQHVFRDPPDRLWMKAIGGLGGAYEFFSLMPPNPEMN